MGLLTAEEIRSILDALAREVHVKPTLEFPYEIVKRSSGYSKDPKTAALQAKLSIMLEMTKKDG